MRPKEILFTTVVADADGYLNDATGAGPWTTILANPSGNLAYQVTHTSSSDQRGITFTITGTDANGREIYETIAGGNSGAVTTTGYFKTVTSVSASATLSTNTFDLGWAANLTQGPWIPLDRCSPNAASVTGVVSGTVNWTLQYTNDNIFTAARSATSPFVYSDVAWTAYAAAGTATVNATIPVGVTAVRVITTTHTAGATITLSVAQS